MYGIRPKSLKDTAQTRRKIPLFQAVHGAPLAKVVQQGSDFLKFVHYHCPIVLVLVHLLLTTS